MKAELIDHMGSDLTVVNAARVSFDKESDWGSYYTADGEWYDCPEDTDKETFPTVSHRDANLIEYLAKHNHWTPFAHCMITLRETVPIIVARQRYKHVVGFCYNEISRRYVDNDPECYYPDEWRYKAENKKQGSGGPMTAGEQARVDSHYKFVCERAIMAYDSMLREGCCPEQARMVLPQGMYTSYYVTGSLAAWARAYAQRIDEHAQKEIQDLAKQWNEIIKPLFPVSWNALTE